MHLLTQMDSLAADQHPKRMDWQCGSQPSKCMEKGAGRHIYSLRDQRQAELVQADIDVKEVQ